MKIEFSSKVLIAEFEGGDENKRYKTKKPQLLVVKA